MNKVELAIQELKKGNLVVIFDHPERENEGDLVGIAEFANQEKINFMIKEARGLITAPVSYEIAKKLNLELMVNDNSELLETSFTVSVDSKKNTTGVSALDRANTIKDLSDPRSTPDTFNKPGHMFPLIAKKGLLSERQGHTEASIQLAQLAGCRQVAYICEILNQNGYPSRQKELKAFAIKHNLIYISIKDIIDYLNQLKIQNFNKCKLCTKFGIFDFYVNKKEDLVLLSKGNIFNNDLEKNKEPLLMRIHSKCTTGDVFFSKNCDCREQLIESMQKIQKYQKGIIIYLTQQEGRGIGLFNKIKTYFLQQEYNLDTYEANLKLNFQNDERKYNNICHFLIYHNILNIDLITNNPLKIEFLKNAGIKIEKIIPIETKIYPENEKYLKTKKNKMKHLFKNI